MNQYMILILLVSSVKAIPFKQEEKIGGRIIGGNAARAGQFPFAAAISVQTANSKFFCGGSLLTQKHVLTAGHCVDGYDNL
jgi:secreted trypsin-like serine protease